MVLGYMLANYSINLNTNKIAIKLSMKRYM